MQYRKFGSLDWNVSALGFGCMRFPTRDKSIDEERATKMLHSAIDAGVNYIDTAWPYHGGESEPLIGRALSQDGYRDRVRLATKLPSWLVHKREDLSFYLDQQLERLQTDTIDFYLLHTLDKTFWNTLKGLDVLEWAESMRTHGKIRRLGFSFHDEYPVFEEIINAYTWDFCQIQFNYMNVAYQAGQKGLRLAGKLGIPVVVMEPLLGGNLADAPSGVQAVWDRAEKKRSPVDWALQWLWDQPEVTTVLSGMSTEEQVAQNIASAEHSGVHSLSDRDRKLVADARRAYDGLAAVPCTTCGYCMPCPHGVNIPRNFTAFNKAMMYDNLAGAKGEYAWMEEAFQKGFDHTDERAVSCIQCRECEPKCPQHIQIASEMPRVHEALFRTTT